LKSEVAFQLKHADAHSAFKKIAGECVKHLQSNQDMVLHGADVEGVHQMRVALRRLRCAFLVFRKIVGSANSKTLMDELRSVADTLGRARDLDIFLTQTLPAVSAQFNNHSGLIKLRTKALAAQTQAYIEVREMLSTTRYRRMLLTLSDWIENERWRQGAHESEAPKVHALAAAHLDKYRKQLKAIGKLLASAQPEARHATRIAAKKLRYTAEFFVSLYSVAESRVYIRKLSQLQDCLGMLNDIVITEKLLLKIVGSSHSRTLDDALNIFSGWNACNTIHGVTQMNKAWLKFSDQKPFWH
jgi:CHAD domain-containing protein